MRRNLKKNNLDDACSGKSQTHFLKEPKRQCLQLQMALRLSHPQQIIHKKINSNSAIKYNDHSLPDFHYLTEHKFVIYLSIQHQELSSARPRHNIAGSVIKKPFEVIINKNIFDHINKNKLLSE